MAIGLARLFGIVLPINFYSPYKSVNIIDFWRRWHISLVSVFARFHLHTARRKSPRRDTPLCQPDDSHVARRALARGGLDVRPMGGLHGLMLAVNHAWHDLRRRIGWPPGNDPDPSVSPRVR